MSESIVSLVAAIAVFFIIIGVYVSFLLSLSKLVETIKDDKLFPTQIHKAWVWTQLIPGWCFIALLVINIKLENAARALENKHYLDFKYIAYPSFLGWATALSFLYSWIPMLGFIAYMICAIMFWVKVSATTKQLEALKIADFKVHTNKEDLDEDQSEWKD